MKKIFLQMPSSVFANNVIFQNIDANNATFRWYLLKSKLESLGYELVTADNHDLKDCEGIIFHDANSLDSSFKPLNLKGYIKKLLGIKAAPDYPTRRLYEEAVNAGLIDKLIFFIWESNTVCPLNFSPKILNKFNKVMSWDDDLLKKSKFIRYCMPMENPDFTHSFIPFNQKKLLTMISFNKFSSEQNELYSARRNDALYFDTNYPNDFDLYGKRWNVPITRLQRLLPFLVKKYTTYRGHVKNKLETLSKYKFNLCYENDAGAKGWVTEKIFDSLLAGIVPIYWGASNIEEYVDSDVFIDRRKFKKISDLADFITKMTEEEYNKYISAAERYKKSDKYAKFLPESFCDTMIKTLELK
ncbi:MAG: glycosyltransferase family 10 [Candidatus Zambryskibacteria bacterium]|nr:glycosyltransferase family 10 [Candidatus Zambryskibacteria bacterium]